MNAKKIEDQILDFLQKDSIPKEVMEHGKFTLIDLLSAGSAGSRVNYLKNYISQAQYEKGSSSIMGGNKLVSIQDAAMVNTTLGIAQEIEEGHKLGGHVGVTPAYGGLAVAEDKKTSGKEFIESFIKSYEVCLRLEHAVKSIRGKINSAVDIELYDPHGTETAVGSALPAGLLLGMGEDKLRNLLRSSLNTLVIAMWDPYRDGVGDRNFFAGLNAETGIRTAFKAKAGIEGSGDAFERIINQTDKLMGENKLQKTFDSLGEEYEITQNYFKIYPSCRYTHPPIDAVRDAKKDLDPDDVEKIKIKIFANAVTMNNKNPTNLTSAKFSIPYVVARYLISNDVKLEHFSEEEVQDTEVQKLCDKIDVHLDEEIEEKFPSHYGCKAEVVLRNGNKLEGRITDPRGDPLNPFPEEVLEEKFQHLLKWSYGDEQGDEIYNNLSQLDKCSDINEITKMLRKEKEN